MSELTKTIVLIEAVTLFLILGFCALMGSWMAAGIATAVFVPLMVAEVVGER